jgi:putative N-acetylmannosamine-6-phosphate epimerase
MSGLDHPLSYKSFFPQYAEQIHLNEEIEMYDTFIAETFGIKGLPIDYYKSTMGETVDRIFGEETNIKYDHKRQLTGILKELRQKTDPPIIAEGGYTDLISIHMAIDYGADYICIGDAIGNYRKKTKYFTELIKNINNCKR